MKTYSDVIPQNDTLNKQHQEIIDLLTTTNKALRLVKNVAIGVCILTLVQISVISVHLFHLVQ